MSLGCRAAGPSYDHSATLFPLHRLIDSSIYARRNNGDISVKPRSVFRQPGISYDYMARYSADAGGLSRELEPTKPAVCFCCVQLEDRVIKVEDQRPAGHCNKSLEKRRTCNAGCSVNENDIITSRLQNVRKSMGKS